MRPKVAGAWYLHQLTEELDFFVLFSSGVGLVGAHGQGNYAAGNAFLDTLAHYRRARGQAGLSIAWGPWAELGMTAGMDDRARARMAEVGLEPIGLDEGLAMFGRLLRSRLPQAAAMRIDWRRLAATVPPRPLWADLASQTEAPQEGPSAVLKQLRGVATGDRMDMLIGHLRSTVAGVLGWNSPDQVGPRQKLFDLGMDSLTSVELRSRLERSLGCPLPLTVAFDYPSVEALADFIAQQLGLLDEEPAPTGVESEEMDDEAERLAAMSEEEVESLLAEKFKDLL
jgi:myxalamid-type polyketide synthase MxaB